MGQLSLGKRFIIHLVALLTILLGMIAGTSCSPTATSPSPTAATTAPTKQASVQPLKKEMTIGVGRELVYGSSDSTYLHWSLNVWESLVSLDDNLQPQPLLAESWTQSDDKLSWTFKLRKGVTFQDGTPFNADAVVANIERLRKRPDVDAVRSYGDLVKVEAVDNDTVRFVHKTPAPSFPAMITMFQSAMFSPQAFDADGNITKPVGTGPYSFVEWKKGESATFQASTTYRGETPSIQKVTYRYIPDASTRVAALKAGEIDAIVDVGGVLPEQVEGLKSDPNIVISTQDVPTTHYMFFNCGKGPFQDVRLRQAASMALDRASIVKNAVGGFGKAGQSVITPMASAWSLPEVAPKYDVEAAKKLVSDATGGAGVKAVLLVSSGFTGRWPYKAMAEIVQSELGKVGITVELRTVDSAAWSKALKAGEYDFSLSPHTLLTGDPDYFFNSWMLSTGEMAKSRSTGYNNPEADKLILSAAAETNTATRKADYDQLQRIAAQDVSVTPLYHETTILAARKNVQNLKMDVQFRASVPSVNITDAK